MTTANFREFLQWLEDEIKDAKEGHLNVTDSETRTYLRHKGMVLTLAQDQIKDSLYKEAME